ncbi:two-component system, chemotaxis family, response regulator CheV [Anaerovibrio lipolyticus DSM 3074]|uniref:Chemotaxis protein CheV n=2 Tax=Anaerovibrio lipolyticus TaxID=82374 RepID=A0A0B2K0Y7_9FIRM|nr:chemotaxis protein [Anaerovibrio lipolyticus]KHM52603.1 chemotaxis protein CheV [Anaerovibrio lipolyticus]SHI82098.1 two-component system, chemotaxis family, response regulator CheV [Anaerovibrio lipolyticus DSM 3074]
MATEEKKGILLETGTNEFEIVEFNIGEVNYGINVAKVREVITRTPVTEMPQAHPYVDGLFTLRGKAIPLVNLPRCLNVQTPDEPKNIIVTEINNYNIGFLVDSVSRIHRISWKNMEPSPEVGDQSRVVGIIKMEGKIILLLDFETIIAEINPEINQKLTTFEDATVDVKAKRNNVHVVCAEDSPLLRELLVSTLHESGYRYVRDFNNGADAWKYLSDGIDKDAPIEDQVRVIISDIEMPQMDGHRLLKLVREDQRYANIPFILFSSLISEEMRRKGEQLGANGQISKPEINQLIGLIDELVFNYKKPEE